MEKVTISKKEYERLRDAEKTLRMLHNPAATKRAKFDDRSFGLLKGRYGDAVQYVRRQRRAWR